MVIKHPNARRMGAILIEEDMGMKFDDYLKEQLQYPEFKKEWEKIQPEYELIAKRFSEEKLILKVDHGMTLRRNFLHQKRLQRVIRELRCLMRKLRQVLVKLNI